MIMELTVKDRKLAISQDHNLYTDGKYVDQIHITFDEEWDEAVAKVGVFYIDDDEPYEVAIIGDRPIKIPNEFLLRRGYINFGIIGTWTDPVTGHSSRYTTSIIRYLVQAGIASFENYVTPDDTLWEQYVQAMYDAVLRAEHANDQSSEIQKDVTEKWIDTKNRHQDVIERSDRVEELDADVVKRHNNILERHISIQEINHDLIEAADRTEFNKQQVVEHHRQIDETAADINIRSQKINDQANEISRKAQEVELNTLAVEQMTDDNYLLNEQVREHSEIVADLHHDTVERHLDIEKQHNAIHAEHHRIHHEVKHFDVINEEAKTTLSQMRRSVHDQGQVLSRVARHAREAAESEINARQSEINALDSELNARQNRIRAEHESRKARYYRKDAEVQANLARQLVGKQIPRLMFDLETMSIYVEEIEDQQDGIEFRLEGNTLLWNYSGYEHKDESGSLFDNEGEVISP